ncbi:hypothetical protein AN958_07925 [Leucoagaricus sp. SymC.cos]|nr:hypothetical protein AN958_07925 [Leucoagaricus sp. SymC.cos]
MEGTKVGPNDNSVSPIGATYRSPPCRTTGTRPVQSAPNSYFRVAVVAGVLLPIATVPYLFARRRISGLQHRCEELEWKLSVMERQLSFSVSESSSIRAEQAKMRATMRDMMEETDGMQQDVMQRVAEQSQANQVMQSDLHKLLEETKQIRTRFSTLRAVGVSLADVAAFMHEMELQMGLQSGKNTDSRGIERLRLLALRMQDLVQKERENIQVSALHFLV